MAQLDEKKSEQEGQNVAQMVLDEGQQKIGWGYRHQQTIILFFCFTVAYSIRACVGVSLVAMVYGFHDKSNITAVNENDTVKIDSEGSVSILNGIVFDEPYPSFSWSKKKQDAILSAFTWGYMTLQLPAGALAHRFGTRYLLTGALVVNGIISFCMPWAVYYGNWIAAVICRILQGLTQACVIPCMHTAFGKWTPLEERGRLTAFAYSGQALGTVLGMPITGFIAASSLGWPGIFRFYGLLACIAGTVLWFLGADSPAKHRSISVAERRYIEEALGQTQQKKHLKVPWKKLLTCKGMWAIILAHIGQTWGQLTLYTEVPAFMDKVMKVNIKANGLLTALPFFMMWLTNFFFSWFTDMLIVKKVLSVSHTRKLAQTLGCFPAAIGLISLAYVKKDIYIVESILVATCSFKVAANLGFHINHIDISPNFAGTMISISNFASNSIGSLAPLVAGFILTDVSSELLWRKVFFVAAGFYLISNFIYVILGTAELADWNDPEEEKEEPLENGESKPMMKN
ncbi:putative inorganic phosphate cotransporter [Choristoneura fumiferana]|uniref:putative inorganic phosphate cotransporter n=1 Tax=Choristoneura fumiferana TaxID=7141 RepID=UPI003D154766